MCRISSRDRPRIVAKEQPFPTPLEVFEGQEAITVKAPLSGYTAKDIEIHVEPQRLFISGQQQESTDEKKGKTIYCEQVSRRVFRSLDLPVRIDPE
jgi:HSP20 family molecular chaperone IbpA